MFTDDELLDLATGVGIRDDSFQFQLLDKDENPIGAVFPQLGGASLSLDTSQAVTRSVSGLGIPNRQALDINPLTDRLAITQVLQNGSVYDLGEFVFGDHTRALGGPMEVWTPNLFDLGFVLDQPLARTHSVKPGGSLLDAFTKLANDIGIINLDIGVTDRASASALSWKSGDSRYTAMAAIASLLGAFPPFFAASRALTLVAPPDQNTGPDHVYGSHTHIIAGSRTITNDSYQAPNRYVAVGDQGSSPVVGVYDIPDDAPHSAANRGYRVTQTTQVHGLATNAQAAQSARMMALHDKRSYERVDFATTADPRHGTYDVLQLDQALYLESAWSLDLVSGGSMTHSGTRLWDAAA